MIKLFNNKKKININKYTNPKLNKNQEISKGYYLIIDWKPLAKHFCVGGYMAKRIIHYYNDTVIKIEDYHPEVMNTYIDEEIPFFDTTFGEEYPPECTRDPFAVIDNTKPIIIELNKEVEKE